MDERTEKLLKDLERYIQENWVAPGMSDRDEDLSRQKEAPDERDGESLSKAGSILADAVSAEFPQYVIFRDQPLPRVEIASLSSEAGIIGAAMLG